jgi:hypothetical protein
MDATIVLFRVIDAARGQPKMETPQEYTRRMLGNVGERDPWELLAATPGRLRALAGAATDEELRHAPAPGRWSSAQILAHLADAEIVAAWRLRSILARDGVKLQAFDQNDWAATFHYERADPAESLAVFEALRRANLRLLTSVDPALHAHAGMHEERGRESIEHLLRMYAGHDLNHLAQVEQLLSEARRNA